MTLEECPVPVLQKVVDLSCDPLVLPGEREGDVILKVHHAKIVDACNPRIETIYDRSVGKDARGRNGGIRKDLAAGVGTRAPSSIGLPLSSR
jgi:hypothetical protein